MRMSDTARPINRNRAFQLAPTARHGRLRYRGPAAAIAKLVAVALAVVLVSGASIAAVAVYNVTSNIAPGIALPGEGSAPPQIGAIEGEVNLILVGSDSGGGNPAYGVRGEQLNDVTMLLHISADHERATVVSFPRDTFVAIPGCVGPDGTEYSAVSRTKINESLSRGGLACTVKTITELTGLDIPFAAKIEFDGVIAMSNAVGGVPVCVATAINDGKNQLKLDAGPHTLQGLDAFRFLQSRYGVGDGSDLGRISNQQQFLSSLVRVLKSSETLSNPLKLYGIATAASQNLEFSNSLHSVDTMVSIASALRDIPLEEVVFVKYPTAGGSLGGRSGEFPVEDAAATLIAAIEADKTLVITGGVGNGIVETPSPSAPPVDPGASPSTPPVDPSAPADPTVVELPSSVLGQNASQQTCTKGQTAGG